MSTILAITSIAALLMLSVLAEKDLHVVAEKCCATENLECCIDSMQFFKPLTCVENYEERLEMVKCMQEQLFGAPNPLAVVGEDIGCCSVFDINDNDPDANCLYQCENVIMTPSLHPREKSRKIRKCMMKNTVYKCFVKCQAMRRIHPESTFHITTSCNLTDFIRPNQYYMNFMKPLPQL